MNIAVGVFCLNDLNEAFWEKVIYVEKWRSSGLGGPGGLWIITSDKILYHINFECFPYDENKLELFNSFFSAKEFDKELCRNIYKVEQNGWKYISNKSIWIKEQYYESFLKQATKEKEINQFTFYPNVFAKILGVNGEIERYDEIQFSRLMDKRQKKYDEQEKQREKLKLLPEHFNWKPMYMNNNIHTLEEGQYALVFKQIEKKISGYKFSILYQHEEIGPLHRHLDASIEMYILFENVYSDISGPLYYPNPDNNGAHSKDCFNDTFNNLDMNDHGRFVRAFRTLDEAKNYAVAVANGRGYANIENILIVPE